MVVALSIVPSGLVTPPSGQLRPRWFSLAPQPIQLPGPHLRPCPSDLSSFSHRTATHGLGGGASESAYPVLFLLRLAFFHHASCHPGDTNGRHALHNSRRGLWPWPWSFPTSPITWRYRSPCSTFVPVRLPSIARHPHPMTNGPSIHGESTPLRSQFPRGRPFRLSFDSFSLYHSTLLSPSI